jgi:hypothetical protein
LGETHSTLAKQGQGWAGLLCERAIFCQADSQSDFDILNVAAKLSDANFGSQRKPRAAAARNSCSGL